MHKNNNKAHCVALFPYSVFVILHYTVVTAVFLNLSILFISSPFTLFLSFPLSSSWSSDGQYCRVVKESGNYVECACSHLSIYTAYAEFATLASYNEAFYASGFICISGTKHNCLDLFSWLLVCFFCLPTCLLSYLFSVLSFAFHFQNLIFFIQIVINSQHRFT